MCTISESLFEKFCGQNDIKLEKIERESITGKKTPDYEIIVHSQKIIVEIKQIETNKEDKKSEELLWSTGIGGTFGGVIGKRISQKITDAMPQLKARADYKYPTLLVIYNNISFTDEYVQPDEIMCGMYGRHVVYLPFGTNRQNEIIDQDFGSNRRLTPSDNATLSALAILKKNKEYLNLDVYLNEYAKIPFSDFNLPNANYFKRAKKEKSLFYTWKKIK